MTILAMEMCLFCLMLRGERSERMQAMQQMCTKIHSVCVRVCGKGGEGREKSEGGISPLKY